MIKFYNPFKPHIATFKGKYIIRRFTSLGFEALSTTEEYWWTKQFWNKYCQVDTPELAKEVYEPIRVKYLYKNQQTKFWSKL